MMPTNWLARIFKNNSFPRFRFECEDDMATLWGGGVRGKERRGSATYFFFSPFSF